MTPSAAYAPNHERLTLLEAAVLADIPAAMVRKDIERGVIVPNSEPADDPRRISFGWEQPFAFAAAYSSDALPARYRGALIKHICNDILYATPNINRCNLVKLSKNIQKLDHTIGEGYIFLCGNKFDTRKNHIDFHHGRITLGNIVNSCKNQDVEFSSNYINESNFFDKNMENDNVCLFEMRTKLSHIHIGKYITLDFIKVIADVKPRVDLYAEGMLLIESNKDILGGEPVFTGTRLSVRHVGGMLEQGETLDNILEDYPYLNHRMVHFARLFYLANPAKGRPRRKSEIHDEP
ncbi:DUF433 domain-containing protein [Methylobacterium terricola]|uniref:DUF433 domain-containing protein n=1 Tax=Methylobacterium terricola TaxID=2583531 RepID=A0A5C4L7Q5_9HYPH|nr:DUF433 domain-containing protein [Methylobacterium terricola]TNC06822.1 DUF433 domain-containing protein [Methylobacterium terricola]